MKKTFAIGFLFFAFLGASSFVSAQEFNVKKTDALLAEGIKKIDDEMAKNAAFKKAVEENLKLTGDKTAGQKVFTRCISCHGKGGEGNKSQKAYAIGGQETAYIVKKVNYFKADKTRNAKMYPFIANLKPQEIADVAAYAKSLPVAYK